MPEPELDPWDGWEYEDRRCAEWLLSIGCHPVPKDYSFRVEGDGEDAVWVQWQPDWKPDQFLTRGRSPTQAEADIANWNSAVRRWGADKVDEVSARLTEWEMELRDR